MRTTRLSILAGAIFAALMGCGTGVGPSETGACGSGSGADRAPAEVCLAASGTDCSNVVVNRVCVANAWVCPAGSLVRSQCTCVGVCDGGAGDASVIGDAASDANSDGATQD
jgi:hypothetical protein